MELKDLVGEHKLTAVDMSDEPIRHMAEEFQVSNCINFVLDGVTYTAIEDPNDGYRSSMREVIVSKYKVPNKFKAVRVMCGMREGDNDVLDIYDISNGCLILSVGTRELSDYYPSFESDWRPEKMKVNEGKVSA